MYMFLFISELGISSLRFYKSGINSWNYNSKWFSF